MPASLLTLERLTKRQHAGLFLGDRDGIFTVVQARRFLKTVGIALRYNATDGLPVASMYRAVWGGKPQVTRAGAARETRLPSESEAQRRAIELTNALLAAGDAIEVSVIADRLVLVHRSLMPALYALVRRGRAAADLEGISIDAARAYGLIEQMGNASIGDVRSLLGVVGQPRHDPAYAALGELQRQLLVCRGAFDVPEHGIPYLSKEGYPYFILSKVHADILKAAGRLRLDHAAEKLLLAYLKPAVFITSRKLISIFKLCLSENDIRMSLAALAGKKKVRIQKVGRDEIVCAR